MSTNNTDLQNLISLLDKFTKNASPARTGALDLALMHKYADLPKDIEKKVNKIAKKSKKAFEEATKLYEDLLVELASAEDKKRRELNRLNSLINDKKVKTSKTAKEATETTEDLAEKQIKQDKVENNIDSTEMRDKNLEKVKMTKVKKSDTVIKEVKLDTLENPLENSVKLPVECELENVQCIYTPQNTIIIKPGNFIPYNGTDILNMELSKVTKSNIEKAINRGELQLINCENNKKQYMVTGYITCSSRYNAMRIITGKNKVTGLDFKVYDKSLSDYLSLLQK